MLESLVQNAAPLDPQQTGCNSNGECPTQRETQEGFRFFSADVVVQSRDSCCFIGKCFTFSRGVWCNLLEECWVRYMVVRHHRVGRPGKQMPGLRSEPNRCCHARALMRHGVGVHEGQEFQLFVALTSGECRYVHMYIARRLEGKEQLAGSPQKIGQARYCTYRGS